MNPQRLLQQLQAAMKESPMQQALLMHMLQESLASPSQPQAPTRQVHLSCNKLLSWLCTNLR